MSVWLALLSMKVAAIVQQLKEQTPRMNPTGRNFKPASEFRESQSGLHSIEVAFALLTEWPGFETRFGFLLSQKDFSVAVVFLSLLLSSWTV